jgi:hypothetical protein
VEKVLKFIKKKFEQYHDMYDLRKYPTDIYNVSKSKFYSRTLNEDVIKNAMLWKWGNINKKNYPYAHKMLINEIIEKWDKYISANIDKKASEQTFIWWSENLKKANSTRYITVAFITHLLHNDIPIIDQHNFRAMNYLNNGFSLKNSKSKPSNWGDIIKLKDFTQNIVSNFSEISESDFDKFLMMFGKTLKKENS